MLENSECLTTFEHPESAVYVFGPEDGSVPQVLKRHCHRFVYIPGFHCLNLSAAVDVILYDRLSKLQRAGKEPIQSVSEMLHENRGPSEVMDAVGWEGE